MEPIATSDPVGAYAAPDEPNTTIVVGIKVPVGHLSQEQCLALGLNKNSMLVPVCVPHELILEAADEIRRRG